MSTAVLNKVNSQLGSLAKQFPIGLMGKPSFSKFSQVLTTSKESVSIANEILENANGFIKKFIKEKYVELGTITALKNQTKSNIAFASSILDKIKNLTNIEGAKIQVDDKDMLKFIASIQKLQTTLLYISDYLNFAMDVMKSKKQVKNGKVVKYTLDELLNKLKAA